MPIRVQCPGCGKNLQAKEKLAGRRANCPSCGHKVQIPESLPEPPEQPAVPIGSFGQRLGEALDRGDVLEIAQFIHGQEFILIQAEDESGGGAMVPWMAEVEESPALVVFESMQHAGRFAAAMPDMFENGESIPGFTVEGTDLLTPLPDGCGLLLNPECEDSVFLPPGLVDELRTIEPATSPKPQAMPESAVPRGEASKLAVALREEVMTLLEGQGFRPANWLPLPDMARELRPVSEIAGRLMAIAGLFTWVSAPEAAVPSDRIRAHMQGNKLGRWLTEDETKIISLPREAAAEAHAQRVGWRLENMWPLAWVLGYGPEPTIEAAQIDPAISREILFSFVGGLDGTVDELVQKSQLRPTGEVIALEDRFYCAHNAVRSAQLGEDTVPEGFHPIEHGGVVHERRHALTWCLSPGTKWDDTDLST